MGWVVKSLRTDVFDALRLDAERDARRVRRSAGRTAADVADQLDALEHLGLELRATVRGRRARPARVPHPALGAPPAPAPAAAERRMPARRATRPAPEPEPEVRLEPEPGPAPRPGRAPDAPRREPASRARGGRASLHASPLAQLFRATDERRPAPGSPVA